MRDVAKLAQVALMTVSRVINNHPSIKPSTRKKVEAAIATLGYEQNEAARLLKGERSKLIGLIVPDISDHFFASCAHTVQQIAREHGFMTLVVSSERDADIEFQEAQVMVKRHIAGLLIVTSAQKGDERLRLLQNTGLAIVSFDRPLPEADVDCVLVENRVGTEAAAQHLIEHGHRRIAFMGYDEVPYTGQERIQGYLNKMHGAKLKPQLAMGLWTVEAARQWLDKSLARKNPVTAIITNNNRSSLFLLTALKNVGLRIPEDIAVIGFDDFEFASILSPPLTVVAQNPTEMARRSMALLLASIDEAKTKVAGTSAKVFLPTKLIIRGSCGYHEADGSACSIAKTNSETR